jgi:predicted transcriptional regulator
MNNDREHKENNSSHKDLEDRLRYVGKKVWSRTDRAFAELLYGNYPNLNHKEFAICRTIVDTLWELEGHAFYLEVQERASHNFAALFEDVTEIEIVIKRLAKNGIVKLETIYTRYGSRDKWSLHADKGLRLRDDIEHEIYEIIWEEFDAAMKEASTSLSKKENDLDSTKLNKRGQHRNQ